MASGWMPQARARAGAAFPSVSPEPAGPAQCAFVATPRQLGTSWEPLICSAPAMIHQHQPNPRWTQADMAQSSARESRYQKPGTRGGFLPATYTRPVALAGSNKRRASARQLSWRMHLSSRTEGLCSGSLLWQSGCPLPQRTLDIPKAPHIFKLGSPLLKMSRVLTGSTGGCSR